MERFFIGLTVLYMVFVMALMCGAGYLIYRVLEHQHWI